MMVRVMQVMTDMPRSRNTPLAQGPSSAGLVYVATEPGHEPFRSR